MRHNANTVIGPARAARRGACPGRADFVNSEGASSADWYTTCLNDYIVDIPESGQWAW